MGVAVSLGFLGPFELRIDGGNAVPLGGRRQRALLLVLALDANQAVSNDRLIDELWGENPPPTALHTVQVFVSRLRGALGDAGNRLVTRSPGYLLEVGPEEIDADRCGQMYATARAALAAGEPSRATALLHEAQALWRGPPLADFTYEPFAQATIARLEELRISCREELIEAELASGRHAEIILDLESLVREHPLRERPRGQLMLALYRCGRQAEALDVYQRARRMLVEELAVEPSAALRELEQAILRQEPSLAVPPVSTTAGASTGAASPLESAAESVELSSVEAVAPSEPRTPAMLRKTVTVLVATLAGRGPTGLADPEVAMRLIALGRDQAQRIVRHHGGAFVAGLGGQVVGVFGLPVTSEDDALRALRAADELRNGAADLSKDQPTELIVRIGIDTGEVVAEGPDELFGEPLSGATAFVQQANDADVLLSEATRRLASDAIRTQPTRDGSAWQLLGLIKNAPAVQRRLWSPMVDRTDELAAARRAFTAAAEGGNAHLLTVIGDAGIGKSRLAKELADQLGEQATVLTGRCLSYGEGVAFWPLREALTRAADGESREAIRSLLGDAEDADLVAEIIAATLGLTEPESFGEQVPWAFRRLFEVLARRRPLMLVIEDVHWAESALLDLVDYLVDWLTAPALLQCLARPELLDARPRWGGGRSRVSSLVLVPLSEEDSLGLVRLNLGERSLSDEASAEILKTAEGNPLFVEQLLAINTTDPGWEGEREIPATIEGLLAARLDRLGPGERAFIERAAVIGREFWLGAVVELLPAEPQAEYGQHVRTLVQRGLIHPEQSTLSGEEALAFHHILIRDVAYRNTSKILRGELHERFADWIARRGEGYDEFVGYHLEQAFSYQSQLARPRSNVLALAERGGQCLARAGRRALSRGDTNAAVKLLRRSADLFESSGSQRPDVLLDLGGALSDSGDFRDAEWVLEEALSQARATHADAVGARALIELSYRRALVDPTVPVREMLAVAEQAIAVFDQVGDHSGISRAWFHVAKVNWIRCQAAEMERVLERALRHAEQAGDWREQSRILGDLARAAVTGPRPVDDGIRRCRAILERGADDVVLTAVTETMLAVLEAAGGNFAKAREGWQRSKRRLGDVGLSVTVAVLQMYSAFIELMAGNPENAQPEVAEAYAQLERVGEGHRRATTAAVLGRLLCAQGRYDESEHFSRISEETASKDDVGTQVIWRGTRGKVMAQGGKAELAAKLADSGVALAEKTDFLMLHGDALSDRAEVLRILSKPEQAARDLQQAIRIYERKGATVSAAAARRSCDSLTSASAASRSA